MHADDDFDVDSPPPITDEAFIFTPGSLLEPLGSDDEAGDDQLREETNNDEWYGRSLHDRWIITLKGLVEKNLRWDDETNPGDDLDPGTRVLGPKERESLAEMDDRNMAFPTVLHHLAANSGDDSFNSLPGRMKVTIVGYLLHKHQERKTSWQETLDSPEDPILTRAFANQNDEFIRFVIKNFSSQLPHLLSEKDINGANCFHYVFKKHIPEAVDHWIWCKGSRKETRAYKPITLDLTKTLHYLTFLINFARPECIVARDGDGNTPMHYAMSYRVARMPTGQYRRLVLEPLIEVGDKWDDPSSQFNNAGHSPYLYFERTRQEFNQSALLRAQKSTRSRTTSSMARGPETEEKLKRDPIHQPLMARSKNESSAYMSNVLTKEAQDKRSRGDSHMDMETGLQSRAMLSSLQLEARDTMRRDSRVTKARAGEGQTPITGWVARVVGDSSQNTQHKENPSPTPSSPVIEGMTSSSGVADPARAASPHTGRDPLAVESEASGKQTALAPVPRMSKYRVDTIKEEASLKNLDEVKKDHAICIVNAEAVRHQLKLHYIRKKSDLEAKELLYGRVASDRNLYFDATNLKRRTPKELTDLISMLARPGGFEDTLSYVSLPVLAYTADNSDINSGQVSGSFEANQRRQRGSNSQEKRTMGRSSAVAVLDKLAECGVRKIIRLTVEEDFESPPHTDAAIERAVRGADSLISGNRRTHPRIEVEIWDWRKFDLSPDVIRFAWPKVFEVNLYWSGNQTVIRGWASESGIPRLFAESERCLKRVIIHWSPGFETIRRCESLLEELKTKVEKRTKESVDSKTQPGVTVDFKRLATGQTSKTGADNYLGPHVPGDLSVPPEHGWIEAMKKFREAIMTLHGTFQNDQVPDRVKVALIDDGVDLASLNMYANRVEVSGMSYCTRGTSSHNPSWHQSSNRHGTIMANSITRLNPWVLLYAMRIQDDIHVGPRNELTLRIHAASAARAIEDAIILKVDIISISWTIRDLAASDQRPLHDQEANAIESLKAAINSAKEKGILIFCSASDDIKKKGVDTLPYSQARDYVFRIGAADAYGWSDKATEDQRTIDYFLPGNQVADDVNPRLLLKEELKYRDGSSVATALAAGLASLMLYIVNVMKIYYTSSKQPQNLAKITRYGNQLRKRDGMKKAFDNIITDDNYKDKRFLPVWDLFGSRAKDIVDKTKDIGTKWDLLDELCTLLAA